MASNENQALKVANLIGYPLVVRPSYVLGGRAMAIVNDRTELENYLNTIGVQFKDNSILLDKFLSDSIEVDVDALCDGENVTICGIMEHIEEAGIHSGDSACAIPPFSLTFEVIQLIKSATVKLGLSLRVIGLMNIQKNLIRMKNQRNCLFLDCLKRIYGCR